MIDWPDVCRTTRYYPPTHPPTHPPHPYPPCVSLSTYDEVRKLVNAWWLHDDMPPPIWRSARLHGRLSGRQHKHGQIWRVSQTFQVVRHYFGIGGDHLGIITWTILANQPLPGLWTTQLKNTTENLRDVFVPPMNEKYAHQNGFLHLPPIFPGSKATKKILVNHHLVEISKGWRLKKGQGQLFVGKTKKPLEPLPLNNLP